MVAPVSFTTRLRNGVVGVKAIKKSILSDNDALVTGFSHMHDSGTGGVSALSCE